MNRFQAWYRALPRALRALLTINVVIYLAWVLVLAHLAVTQAFVFEHLALDPSLPAILFEPWQLVTYNFLHLRLGLGGLLHIGFNMLWLYWIGREHEELRGANQLLALYLITGIGGGVLSVVLHALFPQAAFFGGIIHGASGSVLGVMTAVAVMYPQKKIGLLLIGTVRLLYVVLAFLVLDLLFLSGGTAVGAHLGGALFGFLFVQAEQRGLNLTSWAGIFFRDRRPPRRGSAAPEGAGLLERLEAWLSARGGTPERAAPRGETKREKTALAKLRAFQHSSDEADSPLEIEVDRILEKISEQGLEALTEEERRVLDEASRRLN